MIGSLEGVVTAYSAWSLFWGVPLAVRWWLGLSERVAHSPGRGTRWLPQAPLFVALLIPVALGAAYGFLGRALQEWWRCRKIALAAGSARAA